MKKVLLALLALAVTAGPLALATGFQPEPSDKKPAADRPDTTTSSGLPSQDTARLPERRAKVKKAPKKVVKHRTVKKKVTTKDENW